MTRLQVRDKPPKLCYRSVEFRASEPTGDGRTLEGYAAVFDSPAMIETFFGDFEEQIASGAFKRTLKARTPVLQFDHGRDMRTGSIPIGSIRDIAEDDHGLFVSARLFDNDVVEPIRQAIEAEAIDGMSFRFRIIRQDWHDAAGTKVSEDDEEFLDMLFGDSDRGPLRRTIREVELFELGPVVFPAYDATSVGVRSLLAALEGEWDASANESRLPSPMSVVTARNFYAWYDSEAAEDGEMPKSAGKLPHHFVGENGSPGAASINGVRNALSRLPQTQGLSDSDRETIQRHLNNHLPDNEDDNEASSEPAATGTSDVKADPAVRHSADLGEPADWYLPGPSEVL